MSRTRKTDPWMIRAYRYENRPVDPDWRTKWHWRNAPDFESWDERQLWWDSEPELPYMWYRQGRRSNTVDRKLTHRKYRAYVRDMIANENYDIEHPRSITGWEDWKW